MTKTFRENTIVVCCALFFSIMHAETLEPPPLAFYFVLMLQLLVVFVCAREAVRFLIRVNKIRKFRFHCAKKNVQKHFTGKTNLVYTPTFNKLSDSGEFQENSSVLIYLEFRCNSKYQKEIYEVYKY